MKHITAKLSDYLNVIIFGALAIAIAISNFVWFGLYQGVDASLSNTSWAIVAQQRQITKLKLCIEQDTKPCNIDVVSPAPPR